MPNQSRQRFYLNGKLKSTDRVRDIEVNRTILNRTEADWNRSGLNPLTLPGMMPTNKAHSINRISEDELIIVNTENQKLRFVNVPVKDGN